MDESSITQAVHTDDDGFEALRVAMQGRLELALAEPGARLFAVDTAALWSVFLDALAPERRQHYLCRACRQFVERFGGLVCIDARGGLVSAVWPGPSGDVAWKPLEAAVRAIRRSVLQRPVVAVFYGPRQLGTAQAGRRPDGDPWTHFAVHLPADVATRHRPTLATQSDTQAAASRAEDRRILARSVGEFPRDIVVQARALLTGGSLYRSEIAEGAARWLLELHDQLDGVKGELQENLLWRAVADAPPGFTHVRSAMLGSLLEDIRDGRPFEEVASRWAVKAGPLQHMRPQAPPAAGNVQRAEKLFAELGLAASLRRRYARREELRTIWTPTVILAKRREGAPAVKVTAPPGVFADVPVKGPARPSSPGVTPPPVVMTFAKFRSVVLPQARRIEQLAPAHGNYGALVTAADPDAPRIVQWDREDDRNPVTWYVSAQGSPAERWNLTANTWIEVTAIALGPHMWRGEEFARQHGACAFLILDKARDTASHRSGGLFPAHLRSELHEVRATIEAHASRATIEGAAEATACGYKLETGATWDVLLRVTEQCGHEGLYRLDRWD